MRLIQGYKKYNRRKVYMEKIKAKDLLNELLQESTNDWNELCTSCRTLIKDAQMTDEEIDEIVEKVKRENG